jgi:hypothetical protein
MYRAKSGGADALATGSPTPPLNRRSDDRNTPLE